MTTILVTHSANFKDQVINEILKLSPGAKIHKNISQEVITFTLQEPYINFIDKYNGTNLIFTHHVFECAILDYNFNINEYLEENSTCKLHYRYSNSYETTATPIIDNIKEYMISNNILDNNSERQLNIYFDEKIYLGVNSSNQTLSPWNGGVFRYKKYDNFISRAEFKLLEIIELTKLEVNKSTIAVDFGAAPGGWTKILAEFGANVTAVDPAELDKRVLALPNVKHFKGLAQNYKSGNTNVGLIVNDMREDATKSCSVLCDTASMLKQDASTIITIKLPNKGQIKCINSCIAILQKQFYIKFIRHLYHNRNEVTILAKKL